MGQRKRQSSEERWNEFFQKTKRDWVRLAWPMNAQYRLKQEIQNRRKENTSQEDYFCVSDYANGVLVQDMSPLDGGAVYYYFYPMTEDEKTIEVEEKVAAIWDEQEELYQKILGIVPDYEMGLIDIHQVEKDQGFGGKIFYSLDDFLSAIRMMFPSLLLRIRDIRKHFLQNYPQQSQSIPKLGVMVQSSLVLDYPTYIYPVTSKGEGLEDVDVLSKMVQKTMAHYELQFKEKHWESLPVTITIKFYDSHDPSFQSPDWYQVYLDEQQKEFLFDVERLIWETVRANMIADSVAHDGNFKTDMQKVIQQELKQFQWEWKHYTPKERKEQSVLMAKRFVKVKESGHPFDREYDRQFRQYIESHRESYPELIEAMAWVEEQKKDEDKEFYQDLDAKTKRELRDGNLPF